MPTPNPPIWHPYLYSMADLPLKLSRGSCMDMIFLYGHMLLQKQNCLYRMCVAVGVLKAHASKILFICLLGTSNSTIVEK